jgi:hypothetical protein
VSRHYKADVGFNKYHLGFGGTEMDNLRPIPSECLWDPYSGNINLNHPDADLMTPLNRHKHLLKNFLRLSKAFGTQKKMKNERKRNNAGAPFQTPQGPDGSIAAFRAVCVVSCASEQRNFSTAYIPLFETG